MNCYINEEEDGNLDVCSHSWLYSMFAHKTLNINIMKYNNMPVLDKEIVITDLHDLFEIFKTDGYYSFFIKTQIDISYFIVIIINNISKTLTVCLCVMMKKI